MSDDIRADVAAALAGTLSGDDGASEAPVEAPPAESLGGGDETPAPVADAAGDSPAEPNPPAEDAPEKPAGEAGRARDSTGRFVQGKGDAKAPVRPAGAPAALAPKPVAPQARPPGAPPAPAAAAPPAAVKAPQSWKPAAREAWAKMPPELRAALEPEVTRREKETAQVLEQTAQARHIAAAYGQVVGPYSAMIHSEGTSPPQFIGQLLQTAQALRTAPPGHKALAGRERTALPSTRRMPSDRPTHLSEGFAVSFANTTSDIVATTLEARSGTIADNVTKNNALLALLKQKGRQRTVGGGRTIVEELSFAENANGGWYSGYDTLPTAAQDVISAAEYNWKQYAVPVTISGLESSRTPARRRIIDLLEERIGRRRGHHGERLPLRRPLRRRHGQRRKDLTGLDAAVPQDPTTGTYGGINRATWTFWRSQLA
jgi:hypothetical protein